MALFHTIPVPLLVHEYTSTRVHQYLEYRFLPSSWLSEGIHYPTPLVSQCVPALILPSILIRPSQYLPTLLPPSLSQGKARAGQLGGGGAPGGGERVAVHHTVEVPDSGVQLRVAPVVGRTGEVVDDLVGVDTMLFDPRVPLRAAHVGRPKRRDTHGA